MDDSKETKQEAGLPEILWKPDIDEAKRSLLASFHAYLKAKGHELRELAIHDADSYLAFHEWTTKHPDLFWGEFARWAEFRFSKEPDEILRKDPVIRKSSWFSGARLNAAENLLRHAIPVDEASNTGRPALPEKRTGMFKRVPDEKEALLWYVEGKRRGALSYKELYRKVSQFRQGMQALGIQKGDRVCGLLANMPEAVIAMLATLSLGAVWSSCSPDFGTKGVLDRFGQIEASLLLAVDAYQYKGKRIDCRTLVREVSEGMPSLRATVLVPFFEDTETPHSSIQDDESLTLAEFLNATNPDLPVGFEKLAFDHPIYIMYSSGTTGLPKCLVQGAGVILNHAKEHLLHGDLRAGDSIFFYTTCGWMMWNWLASALFCGARILLYEGSPMFPTNDVLFEIASKEKINYFGTSPKFLASLEESGFPADFGLDLSSLKGILSTGAPLAEDQFRFVYKKIKSDVRLSSIAGGTDLNGCFALGNPMLGVRAGELQCKGLGMAVCVEESDGTIRTIGEGELVCTEPFPSMPLYFWGDPEGTKYKNAYFSKDESVWRHGDYIRISKEGSLRFFGRSDATLNPGGVRIGTADLYSVLEGLDCIEDSIAIGQPWKNDVRVVLFVSLKEGHSLSDELRDQIRARIRRELTPRHVPEKILEVSAIPYTHNGKKVELAVKKAVLGEPVSNTSAIARPELLQEFRGRKELN